VFSRLRKATVSFVMSVVRMKQPGFHWTDFHEIWYLSTIQKSIGKFKLFKI